MVRFLERVKSVSYVTYWFYYLRSNLCIIEGQIIIFFVVQQIKSKILERVESVTSDTGTATSGDEGKLRKRR